MANRRVFFTMQNSTVPELALPLAVVCHDAGGANQIAHWLKHQGFAASNFLRPCIKGPAEKIWQHILPQVSPFFSLEEAMDGAKTLISGTGWASDLEHQSRALAKKMGLRSIAVLDHWVNYTERFCRQGKTVLPDEIWVSDTYAHTIAVENFPDCLIRLIANSYLDEQLAGIPALPADCDAEVLYLLEPKFATWGRNTLGEFQALDYFIENLVSLGIPDDTPIRLRPHPSEDPSKYINWISSRSDLKIALDDATTLRDAIVNAKWVAGCESYGMVVALHAGRHVICSLPPWAPACCLPHAGITPLAKMASALDSHA